jgi:hypothetical protein
LIGDPYVTVFCAPSAADMTVSLRPVSEAAGRILQIVKTNNAAFKVILNPSSNELINGALTQEIAASGTQYKSRIIACDGAEWYIIGGVF